jgi:carbon-monoxide dehydrogenase medium subunit
MKPAPFEYHAPTEVGEAVRLLAALGDNARPLAGGQSLMPMLNLRLARPAAIVDLNRITSLAYHRLAEDEPLPNPSPKGRDTTLVIGALCRQRDIERDQQVLARCAAIADAVPLIGHIGIRNRGTVVGSLAHADPSAEWPVLAVLLDATLEVEGAAGRRSIAAKDFFKGLFATDLQAGELVVEARFPLPPAGAGSAFVEVARRHGDFALGAAAAVITLASDGSVATARLALGGFDSVPVRVTPDPARAATEVHPVDDIHAPASYRRKLAVTLAQRALQLAEQRARREANR